MKIKHLENLPRSFLRIRLALETGQKDFQTGQKKTMARSLQFQRYYVPFYVLMTLAALILNFLVRNTAFGDVELPLYGTFYISIFSSGAVNNMIEQRVARFVHIHVREDQDEEEMIRGITNQIRGQLFLIIDNPTGDDFNDHGDQDDGGSSDGEED